MNGIARIQKELEDNKNRREAAINNRVDIKEIFFKDGDQAFVSSAATGADDDTLLSDYKLYTFENGRYLANVLDDERVDTSNVPPLLDGTPRMPTRKFAFWGYIHYVLHTKKSSEDMEAIAGPGGRKLFKETIDDYRIIPISFGRGEANWIPLLDIYEDWGSLDKGVIRIKRNGAGMETTYNFTATPKTEEIPEDRAKEIATLSPIMDYMFGRYGEKVTIFDSADGAVKAVDGNESFF